MKLYILPWLLLAGLTNAQPKDLSFSGFGTLGVVSSDSKAYGYRTNLDQGDGSFNNTPEFANSTVLGLQLDYALHGNTDLVFQSVYYNQHTVTLESTTRLAFARFSANPAWSFRLGRTALDLFLLTEYRDVGFGYIWAHPPSEVYNLLPNRYLDGVDITHNGYIHNINFRSKLFAGTSSSDFTAYQRRGNVKLTDIVGVSFNLETIRWSLQFRYTSARFTNELESQAGKALTSAINTFAQALPDFDTIWPNSDGTIAKLRVKDRVANYMSLGGKYDWQRWSALAEISQIGAKADLNTVTAGYTSLMFHSQNYSLYGIYAAIHTNIFDIDTLGIDVTTLATIPTGAELYAGVDTTLNTYNTNQSTWSLGGRWNLSPSLALKIQWDRTRIKEKGGVLWLNKDFATQPKETINTLFTNLSFIF